MASPGDGRSLTSYLLIFNKATASGNVHYLVLDNRDSKTRILPKVNTVVMSKVKDVIGYRIAVLGVHLYIIGGRHCQSGVYLNHCYRYDPRNGQWLRLAPLLTARLRFSLNVMNGCLYVCGGEMRGGRITDTAECYDPMADTWKELRAMPTPLADHAACVEQNRLFVSGGVADVTTGATHAFWQYDSVSDFWSQADKQSKLPHVMERHLMAAHDGTLYCFAGMTLRKKGQKLVEVEDDKTISFDCTKGNIDTKITGVWSQNLPAIASPRCFAACCQIDDDIYVIGGRNYCGKKDITTIDQFNVTRKKWTEYLSLGDGCFTNIDCCVLNIPKTNLDFSNLGLVMDDRWIMW